MAETMAGMDGDASWVPSSATTAEEERARVLRLAESLDAEPSGDPDYDRGYRDAIQDIKGLVLSGTEPSSPTPV